VEEWEGKKRPDRRKRRDAECMAVVGRPFGGVSGRRRGFRRQEPARTGGWPWRVCLQTPLVEKRAGKASPQAATATSDTPHRRIFVLAFPPPKTRWWWMEIYVPQESLGSQYPEWARWHYLNFKKLRPSAGTKQNGALLFVEGRIDDLAPLDDRPGFEARVTDGKAYGTAVWLTDDPLAPAFDCGCGADAEGSPCVHAMGLLAALVYLFHEKTFISLSPILDNVNALAAGIDRSRRTGRRKSLKRLRLRNLAPGPAYLEGDAELPDPFVQAVNPYRELSRMARNTLELPRGDRREAFRALIDYVCDQKLAFEAENPEGGYLALAPEAATVGTRLRFLADPAADLVRVEPTLRSVEPGDLLADLGGGVLVLREGRIALEDDEKFAPLPDALARMERGFTDFSRDRDEFRLEDFNDFIARLDHAHRRLYRQCDFGQIRDGELVDEDPHAAGALTVQAWLGIDHPDEGPHPQFAYLGGEVGLDFVGLSGVFGDFMRLLRQHAGDADRLLGRRARVDVILAAAARLPRIGKQADRRAHIDATVRRHEFRTEEQSKAAAGFLRQLERDYCRPQSATAPMILHDPKANRHTWHTVRLPLPGLLALTATLYRRANFAELLGKECHTLPVHLRGEAFHEVAEICEHFGIELRVDDETTLARPAAVSVDIAGDAKEDWFELKPSIRCEGFEIPPEQWEQLLQGTLRLESPDGGLIVPRPENPKMLARLVDALGEHNRPGGDGARIHRLQLLDWIAWRKQGLELTLPPEIDALFRELLDFDGIPGLPPPPGLRADMRPYQQRGFEWLAFLHRHRFGACLADDMGLGKTLQSLAFLAHLKAETSPDADDDPPALRALAVLPPSLLYNWESEAARFTPGLRVAAYAGPARDPAVFDQVDLVLTTYDLLRRDIATLETRTFDVVLFDEAQALKNHASRRTRAARRLPRRFTVCLTGTPLENHAGEYHSIMDAALPGLMGERKAFDQALKDGDDSALRRALPFLLRRTKAAILTELPPKVESDVYLEMNDDQREIYTRIVGEVREEVLTAYRQQTRARAGITALAALTRLRQLCVSPALLGHKLEHPAPKIRYLADTAAELRDEGHSVLVFSQFVKALDRIEDALRADGAEPLRLDGSTPQQQRRAAIDAFQNGDTPQVFLISLKVGGVGLNLTRAGHVIHVDPWWNPSVENQASDRAHRIGQEQTVFVQRLLMRDSVEEKIMALKNRKKKLFQAIVDDHAADPKGTPAITKADFQFLLGE